MTYVMSDIHGNLKRFRSVLEQIDLQPEDTLYVLGDVLDRNPYGFSVLYRLMQMPNAVMLLGNHEHMMLSALADPEDEHMMQMWYRNGGDITHQQWKKLPTASRQAMLRYLNRLPINVPLTVNGKDYLLVHGGPEEGWDPETSAYPDKVTHAVWQRLDPDEVYSDRTIIFGHTPTVYYQLGRPMRIWHGKNMIGIDCGCAYDTGRLACLRLEDGMEFYAQ